MSSELTTMLPKWIKPALYEKISGISVDAQTKKRQNGVWLEGIHCKKAPDGNYFINWRECDNWIENGYQQTA